MRQAVAAGQGTKWAKDYETGERLRNTYYGDVVGSDTKSGRERIDLRMYGWID